VVWTESRSVGASASMGAVETFARSTVTANGSVCSAGGGESDAAGQAVVVSASASASARLVRGRMPEYRQLQRAD
jgi:hypothetical protein